MTGVRVRGKSLPEMAKAQKLFYWNVSVKKGRKRRVPAHSMCGDAQCMKAWSQLDRAGFVRSNPLLMTIREANSDDLDRIVLLLEQLGYASTAEQVEKRLCALRRNTSGQAFVAQVGGQIVGVAIVHIVVPIHVESPWALLSALVVDHALRGTGVGAGLLGAAEGFALQQGCSQLELSSRTARTRAHAFYEQNGYREKRLRFVKVLS